MNPAAARAPTLLLDWQPLSPPVPACGLGESPFWHPDSAALWWIDIPGRALHRWQPAGAEHRQWLLPSEPGCVAPLADGRRLLLASRDGLWLFDSGSGERTIVAEPPYDVLQQRFNDGRADAQGRLWVGTIHESRAGPLAALYCWDGAQLQRVAGDVTVSNGLAFSPDAATLYWADTSAHRIDALDFDAACGRVAGRRPFAQFERRQPEAPLSAYGGRPDGAAVDAEGCLWVAMFEGAQLLRLGPDGGVRARVPLPVRCPTMPCFGGTDGRTLFVTSASQGRPADELAALPWSGRVLSARVEVAGLPVNFAGSPGSRA